MQSSARWLRKLAASAVELLSSSPNLQNELTSWGNWFIWSILFIWFIWFVSFIWLAGSSNQTNQTNLFDHIHLFDAAPPFHLQIHLARTTDNVDHARKRQILLRQAEPQDFFPWHSRLNQLFFAGFRAIEIRNQHLIKMPAGDLFRR